ncbi:tyrosine-type recombinase/integrase [Shewanella sp. NIFS-20-20]|uniref:tyrosine-type recombinase/integrase n=1 Tax=Shewanella sp. NIFS-20-20 TaxID=2853806 RepID=UPI001C43DA48|nr:tyrosine-type recombinase/integrase [Shewanella sp. NIFS-20-20]MBV7316889.1 tyrosine-type recombinase/integrase [Shewanella sp. NIFS-20-20]
MDPNHNKWLTTNNKSGIPQGLESKQAYFQQPNLPSELQARIALAQQETLSAKNANTMRNYRLYWQQFCVWCQQYGVNFLPADPNVVMAYLQVQSEKLTDRGFHLSASTLHNMMAAINYAHDINQLPSPTKLKKIQEYVDTINRNRRRTTVDNQKRAIVDFYLEQLIETTQQEIAPLRRARDLAIILMGRQGAFRRSELAQLTLNDLEFLPDRLNVSLRFSKASQDGKHRQVKELLKNESYSCYQAIEEWLAIAALPKRGNVPLFHSITRWDKLAKPRGMNHKPVNFSGQEIYRIIKKRCQQAHLDAELFGAHSLRSGLLTQWGRDGKSVFSMKQRSGHRSITSVDRYVQSG